MEYKRFAEFCDACKEDRYPGICLGPSGVGKTLAARHYAQWKFFNHFTNPHLEKLPIPDAQLLLGCDTVIYTPWVSMTANSVIVQLLSLMGTFEATLLKQLKEQGSPNPSADEARVRLIIIDEANRLKYQAIEHIRDLFDQLHIGIVLLGLHGLEKYVARLPQFRNRLGFRHEFRPLSTQDMLDILESEMLNDLEYGITNQDFDHRDTVKALVRATGGNMRTLHRLCLQIKRVMRINKLDLITKDVIDAARRALIIGL